MAEAEGEGDPAPRDGEMEGVTDAEGEGDSDPEAAVEGDSGTQ